MLKHIQEQPHKKDLFEIPDKIFWEKIKKEKRIYNRNRKNGNLVDERTGKRNEY